MGSEEIECAGAGRELDLVAGAMNNHLPLVRRQVGVRQNAVWILGRELTGFGCVLLRGDGTFEVVCERTSAALIPDSGKNKRTGEWWIEIRVFGPKQNVEEDAAGIQKVFN